MSFFSEPINLQHIQLLRLLHGTARSLFFPRAKDRKIDNFDPTFEAVFLTNWKTGFRVFLKASVFSSSSSFALIVFTNFSSLPWHETISMGLDEDSSFTVSGRSNTRNSKYCLTFYGGTQTSQKPGTVPLVSSPVVHCH